MRRGEVWTVAASKDYASKPRPCVIVQDDVFDATDSITVCGFTTDTTVAPLIRLRVDPNKENGLHERCFLMADKITTVPRARLGKQVGRLDDADMLKLNRVMVVFLGLAGSSR